MEISKMVQELTEQVKQYKAENQTLLAEAKAAKDEVTRITTEYEAKVGEINVVLGEKGANLTQIRDEVLELKTKAGRIIMPGSISGGNNVAALISKNFQDNAATWAKGVIGTSLVTENIGQNAHFKAMTVSGNITPGGNIPSVPVISQEVITRGYETVHYRDIFRVIDTETGTFVYWRDLGTGTGSISRQTPGAVKSKLSKNLKQEIVNATYLAGTLDVDKSMLKDAPFLQGFVTDELMYDFLDVEDREYFANMKASATGPTNGGAGTNAIEKIIYTIANQRKLRYNTDAIIAGPKPWADILVTKPADYSLPNAVIITPSGNIAVTGIPLYCTATDALDDNDVLVVDRRRAAAIMQVTGEGMKIELFKQHSEAVYNNIVTFRIESREKDIIFKPDAISNLQL